MGNQNNVEEHAPARRGRGCMVWFGGVLAGLLILILAGMIYESLSETADAKAYPPPGRMVDVGGYRLHINCTGTGSPTVVIDTGWGDTSAMWGWVQPEVARTTRICTYDRAGMGWSEASPQPRTAREFAKELHTLLSNANEPGPYVLVGHSLGGYTVRVYAHDYPAEVAGLVLIDVERPSANTAPPQPAPKPGGITTSLLSLGARIGVVRLLAGPLGLIHDLPAVDKQAYIATSVTPRSVQAFLDEGMGMAEGGAQAKAVQTLGALPLIVLSAGKNPIVGWTDWQASLLQLSSNSQQLIAEKSDHNIQISQPDAAVAAIVKMVEQLRK
jgi:pimeloyl-ACP methyl ester carboxylesterase